MMRAFESFAKVLHKRVLEVGATIGYPLLDDAEGNEPIEKYVGSSGGGAIGGRD